MRILEYSPTVRTKRFASVPDVCCKKTTKCSVIFKHSAEFLANLQQNINRAIQVYISASGANRPNLLLICGGGAHLTSLTEDLTADLSMEVLCFNPFAAMDVAEKINFRDFEQVLPQLVIAAGLASRSFQPWHI